MLTGEKSAQESAAALENELVRITGFKKGLPPTGISSTTVRGTPETVH